MQVRVLRPLSTANLVFSATFSHQHDNPPTIPPQECILWWEIIHPNSTPIFLDRSKSGELLLILFGGKTLPMGWVESVVESLQNPERNSTHAAGTQIRSEVFTIQIQFFNRHHKHVFPTHTLGHNTPSLPLSIIFSNPPFFLTSQKITPCQFFCKTK